MKRISGFEQSHRYSLPFPVTGPQLVGTTLAFILGRVALARETSMAQREAQREDSNPANRRAASTGAAEMHISTTQNPLVPEAPNQTPEKLGS